MSSLDLGKIKFLWRGAWNQASSYIANDVVAHNSGVWICTQPFSAGVGSECAPGKRDRTSVYGKTLDPAETIIYNVTVQSNGIANFFYIDGVITPAITLYPNVRYRFYQRDQSNTAHRFALSSIANGIFAVGGTEYTTGVTYSGTAGVDGVLDVVLQSSAPTTLYYFSAQDTNYGNGSVGRVLLGTGWKGWQYWDQVTSGFTFKNTWSSATTYYANDIVEYQGTTYLALADNLNKFPVSPGNNHVWVTMAQGDRKTDHNSVAHFMNKGPLDWPYPHSNFNNPIAAHAIKWISRSGRVYHHGPGLTWSHGLASSNNVSNSINIGQPQEVCFNFFDWWASRDNGGSGRMTTPDGMPPKCIQIEHGYDCAYFLFNNGELWSTGSNGNSELGDGTTSNSTTGPRRVINLSNVKIVKVSVAYNLVDATRHVLALDEYGYVWSWGYNAYGQLGLGHAVNMHTPQRIPRGYFNGERITDIAAIGSSTGASYARTSSDYLYSWGLNNVNQLGDNTTTNRYRPVKMLNWDPIVNNGIRKWQVAGSTSNTSFMILDGNGYLWGCGDDQFGHMANSGVLANRTQLTKSTTSPGGTIVDFWTVYSVQTWKLTFIRTTTGTTWVCGLGSTTSYVNGLNASVSTISPPQLIPTTTGITNLKEVYMHGNTGNAYKTIHFLTDAGKVYAQGNGTNGEIGNMNVSQGSNQFDETGVTYYPVLQVLPPSTRIKQIIVGGWTGTGSGATSYNVHGVFYMTDSGQIFANGRQRITTSGRINYVNTAFLMYSQSPGEDSTVPTIVNLAYAR